MLVLRPKAPWCPLSTRVVLSTSFVLRSQRHTNLFQRRDETLRRELENSLNLLLHAVLRIRCITLSMNYTFDELQSMSFWVRPMN